MLEGFVLNCNIEEALEYLYLIENENEILALEPDVAQALPKCAEMGLASPDGNSFRLTEKGRLVGRDVVRRHRLAECLLQNVLEHEAQDVRSEGCQFEHVIQSALEERICILLGHPQTCPHGKPVPPGECCRKARADGILEIRPLCDGKPGTEGTVVYLATRNSREVQKMMAMGILPGASIKLIQSFPSYVFKIGHSHFAVDRPLAEVIYVHWKHAGSPGSSA